MRTIKNDLLGRKLLPPCEGPKLHPFPDRRSPIEFVRLLSPAPTESDSSGAHSHVFEVRIKETLFALKIFKFYHPTEARECIAPGWSSRVPDDILTYHSDPFFAECRAYGGINGYNKETYGRPHVLATRKRNFRENWKEREIAVPCYGYLALSAADYAELLSSKFGLTDWNRSEEDDTQDQYQKQPFRALVKKLVDTERSIWKPAKMLRDLKTLRAIGIYQRDLYTRNYKDGLLVDFSIAWTEPHWLLSLMKGGQLKVEKDNELFLFDRMMVEEGIRTTIRATRNYQYCRKLRNSGFPINDDEDSVSSTGSTEETASTEFVSTEESMSSVESTGK